MTPTGSITPGGWLLVLGVSIILPSAGIMQVHFRTRGAVVYLVLAGLALLVGYRAIGAGLFATVTDRAALALAALTGLALVALIVVVHPVLDVKVSGRGADRDDALELAVGELVHGRYPYYPVTYHDNNPITPLPGAVLLAAPFVLLGGVAYQNLFWLGALFLSMWRYLRDGRSALLLCWAPLALSPVVLHEFVTGGDLIANGLYLPLLILWVLRTAASPGAGAPSRVAGLLLLGLALSSRPNFILLAPLIFSALLQHTGAQRALVSAAVVAATFLVVTLPFYLYDPAHFSPLLQSRKLVFVMVPYAKVVVPAAMLGLACLLALRRTDAAGVGLLASCAAVQALPIVLAVVVNSLREQYLDFRWTWYGLNFLFFGALAAWCVLSTSARDGIADYEDRSSLTSPRGVAES